MNPLVSVIIPIYKPDVNQLQKAINCVDYQTYKPIELIPFTDMDGQGVSWTRNQAIKRSTGEYIALLDQDDWWHPTKIYRQILEFKWNPGIGLSSFDASCMYKGVFQFVFAKKFKPKDSPTPEDILRQNFICCSSIMFPRKVFDEVGGFDESLRYAEDQDFIIRVAKKYPVRWSEPPIPIEGATYIPLVFYSLKNKRFQRFHRLYNEERIIMLERYGKGDYFFEKVYRKLILNFIRYFIVPLLFLSKRFRTH